MNDNNNIRIINLTILLLLLNENNRKHDNTSVNDTKDNNNHEDKLSSGESTPTISFIVGKSNKSL